MKIRDLIDRFGCLTDRIRALTLAASFLIAVVAALDLAQLLNRIREVPINEIADPTTVVSAVVLLGGITAIFAFLFLVFFRPTGLAVRFGSWIAAMASIATYYFVTRQILYGSPFGRPATFAFDAIYYDTFLGASTMLFYLLLGYFLVSPVKLLVIVGTSFKRNARNAPIHD